MQKQKQSRKKPTSYAAPEVMTMESAVESVICLSDGVSLDELTEVEETW